MNDVTQLPVFNPRFDDIRQWSVRCGLIEGSTPRAQLLKTMSELGELADGINKRRRNEIIDGIGDVEVTLVILAAHMGLQIESASKLMNYDPMQWDAKEQTIAIADTVGSIGMAILAGEMQFAASSIGLAHCQLEVLATTCGLTFDECIEHAWDKIKDRTGRLVDGVYIRDVDIAGTTCEAIG